MSKFSNTTLLIASLACATLSATAQQATTKIQQIPMHQTSPASGEQMYANYCGSCHGTKADGNGPAAQALKTPPPNLTLLSHNNGGVFPTQHITSVLTFGVANPAHGNAEMPVWGELLLTLNSSSRASATMVHQRVFNLTNYLKQIQK